MRKLKSTEVTKAKEKGLIPTTSDNNWWLYGTDIVNVSDIIDISIPDGFDAQNWIEHKELDIIANNLQPKKNANRISLLKNE